MEGAELLSHERLIHEMKGKGQFVAGELEIDHSSPRVPAGEDSDDDSALGLHSSEVMVQDEERETNVCSQALCRIH